MNTVYFLGYASKEFHDIKKELKLRLGECELIETKGQNVEVKEFVRMKLRKLPSKPDFFLLDVRTLQNTDYTTILSFKANVTEKYPELKGFLVIAQQTDGLSTEEYNDIIRNSVNGKNYPVFSDSDSSKTAEKIVEYMTDAKKSLPKRRLTKKQAKEGNKRTDFKENTKVQEQEPEEELSKEESTEQEGRFGKEGQEESMPEEPEEELSKEESIKQEGWFEKEGQEESMPEEPEEELSKEESIKQEGWFEKEGQEESMPEEPEEKLSKEESTEQEGWFEEEKCQGRIQPGCLFGSDVRPQTGSDKRLPSDMSLPTRRIEKISDNESVAAITRRLRAEESREKVPDIRKNRDRKKYGWKVGRIWKCEDEIVIVFGSGSSIGTSFVSMSLALTMSDYGARVSYVQVSKWSDLDEIAKDYGMTFLQNHYEYKNTWFVSNDFPDGMNYYVLDLGNDYEALYRAVDLGWLSKGRLYVVAKGTTAGLKRLNTCLSKISRIQDEPNIIIVNPILDREEYKGYEGRNRLYYFEYVKTMEDEKNAYNLGLITEWLYDRALETDD